ncbi:sensor domain-containing diguanylate cyclase [Rhodoferax sp.]|uniref:sensor domain-containing diguanylate cyclase n=1 Tax=Rhodoferax sp. TaxID=50421 RepID=UPI0025E710C5|nr:sensor domain-containing diguanylate cyclase [Rhodoferax sp.]
MPKAPHRSSATAPQRKWALLLALLIVLAAVVTVPYAAIALPVVAPFLPIFAATVTLTEALTAYLLMVQFVAVRRFYLVPLAGAYAYVAMLVPIQLLVFPGVFAPMGLLGGNTQSAVWMWVFWHGGFPFFIGLSLLLRQSRVHGALGQRVSVGQAGLLFSLAPLLACAMAWLALQGDLPPLINGNSFKTLSDSVAGWSVWGLNVAAVALVLLLPKKRWELVNLFLFVAVLASLADVSLTLLSSARYSLGWYVSRLLSVVSSVSLLAALIYQITQFYQELATTHASLLRSSARDKLTGVYNRNSFDNAAQAEWQRAQRSGEPLSLVLVDIDHFKRYNDHFGHVQGDFCLHAVAQALARSVHRPTDMVARYGGEEFVILLPGTRTEQALRIAEQARRAVADLRIPAHAPGLSVSFSAGCASWDANAGFPDFEDMLVAADQALYKAKAQGRNQVWAQEDQVLRPASAYEEPQVAY